MLKYVNKLQEEGYKYIIMPTRRKRTFYATKANQKKDGSFRDTASFDEYALEKDEVWPFDRGVYICLQA